MIRSVSTAVSRSSEGIPICAAMNAWRRTVSARSLAAGSPNPVDSTAMAGVCPIHRSHVGSTSSQRTSALPDCHRCRSSCSHIQERSRYHPTDGRTRDRSIACDVSHLGGDPVNPDRAQWDSAGHELRGTAGTPAQRLSARSGRRCTTGDRCARSAGDLHCHCGASGTRTSQRPEADRQLNSVLA